ncbi:MAG: hypothetical protein PGN15_08720 [Aeromicrobium erythreum]
MTTPAAHGHRPTPQARVVADLDGGEEAVEVGVQHRPLLLRRRLHLRILPAPTDSPVRRRVGR